MHGDEQKVDWVHLPADCAAQSLWECLHDGELLSCKSNLIERNVTLEFTVHYLVDDPNSVVRFIFRMEQVTSVRAKVWFRWPGGVSIPEGTTREDECRLIDEYWAKWREESINWQVFESALTVEPLQIYEAELALAENQITLKIGGFLDGEPFDHHYCSVFIHGGSLAASRSDGHPFSLEEFLRMGHEYWESLGGH